MYYDTEDLLIIKTDKDGYIEPECYSLIDIHPYITSTNETLNQERIEI